MDVPIADPRTQKPKCDGYNHDLLRISQQAGDSRLKAAPTENRTLICDGYKTPRAAW